MFRRIFMNSWKQTSKFNHKAVCKVLKIAPVGLSFIIRVSCDDNGSKNKYNLDFDSLEHEFFIKQATTVSVNAATQLLTVTLVAIEDTGERLREALTKEICLVKQALEWGDENIPAHHWDQLVAVRASLTDLRHNLHILLSYMDYAEKLATVAAEVSYLSGNTVASDAICERIEHASRVCITQKQLTHQLQQESLELQQQIIIASPQLQEKLHEPPDKVKKPEPSS